MEWMDGNTIKTSHFVRSTKTNVKKRNAIYVLGGEMCKVGKISRNWNLWHRKRP